MQIGLKNIAVMQNTRAEIQHTQTGARRIRRGRLPTTASVRIRIRIHIGNVELIRIAIVIVLVGGGGRGGSGSDLHSKISSNIVVERKNDTSFIIRIGIQKKRYKFHNKNRNTEKTIQVS